MLRLAILKTNLKKKKKKKKKKKNNNNNNNNNNSRPQQKINHRLQRVAEDYQLGDRPKEGTQIFIRLNLMCG